MTNPTAACMFVKGYVGTVHEAFVIGDSSVGSVKASDWPDEPIPGPKNSMGLPSITIKRKLRALGLAKCLLYKRTYLVH